MFEDYIPNPLKDQRRIPHTTRKGVFIEVEFFRFGWKGHYTDSPGYKMFPEPRAIYTEICTEEITATT